MFHFRFAAATVFLIPAQYSFAAPIDVNSFGNPWEVYHFREFRGSSSIGATPSGPSSFTAFGVLSAVPNGKGENGFIEDDPSTPENESFVSDFVTTGVARQNGREVALNFDGSISDPNSFSAGIGFDPDFLGSWEITLTNGPDTLVVNTPEVGDVDVPARVTDVQLSQESGITTPTITWQNNETSADVIAISIYDLNLRNENTGRAERVYLQFLGNDENMITVPDGELAADGKYSVRVSTRINRKDEDGTAGTNPSGSSQAGAPVARGDTFFDFVTSDLGDENVILPELTFGDDDSVVFNFNNPVVAEQVQYYDPFVAIGYDYQIGIGDPFFNSFILPEIGDDLFSLHLWNGTNYEFGSDVFAGVEYFLEDQTDRFRILGVETGAALDPTDPSAFVTGLSFVSGGQFTGTMTPITTFVEPSQVPLPATFWGLLLGIGGLITSRRRKAGLAV